MTVQGRDITQEIILRAMEPEDIDLLYQVENDTTLCSVGAANVPYSRQLLRDFVLNTTGDIYTDKQLRLMIELVTQDGKVTIGMVDLINFNPQHRRAEVGITVLPAYRHHGYATAALKQLLAYALNTLHLQQLYAIVAKSNVASQRLFESSNFMATATLSSWLLIEQTYEDAVVMQKIF